MGLFVAIEGGDGSGKATQANLLEKRYIAAGKATMRISFPQYGKPSAVFVEEYLNGLYGESNQVSPELGSLAYAIDRFDAKKGIESHLRLLGSRAVADRYVASNLAHQGAKIDDPEKRHAFYNKIINLEYGLLKLPQPDLNVVLLVPSKVAQQNVDNKSARSYTTAKRDIHEADADHLEKAKANYQELCELYPDRFIPIECMKDNSTMRSIEEIHEDIWALVESKVKE